MIGGAHRGSQTSAEPSPVKQPRLFRFGEGSFYARPDSRLHGCRAKRSTEFHVRRAGRPPRQVWHRHTPSGIATRRQSKMRRPACRAGVAWRSDCAGCNDRSALWDLFQQRMLKKIPMLPKRMLRFTQAVYLVGKPCGHEASAARCPAESKRAESPKGSEAVKRFTLKNWQLAIVWTLLAPSISGATHSILHAADRSDRSAVVRLRPPTNPYYKGEPGKPHRVTTLAA